MWNCNIYNLYMGEREAPLNCILFVKANARNASNARATAHIFHYEMLFLIQYTYMYIYIYIYDSICNGSVVIRSRPESAPSCAECVILYGWCQSVFYGWVMAEWLGCSTQQ